MTRRTTFRNSIAIAVIVIMVTPAAGSAGGSALAAGRRCPRFHAPHIVGHVRGLPGIREISGVVSSHRHRRTLWVEQDSGPGQRRLIHAITPTGRGKASVSVEEATNRDWEDIAFWDGRLWVGDIGDNSELRTDVQVYWFREPRLNAGSIDAKILTLHYPGGTSHNAEAMFVTSGNLYIVSKDNDADTGTVFRADVDPLRDGASRRMHTIGTVAIGGVTAADTGPRGIIVKNYTQGLFYPWSADHRVATTIHRRPCEVEIGAGESIAFATWNRSFFSIPEGRSPAVYLSRPR